MKSHQFIIIYVNNFRLIPIDFTRFYASVLGKYFLRDQLDILEQEPQLDPITLKSH